MLPHLSTSTPASEVSSADFAAQEARNDKVGNSDESAVPSMADILRNSPAAKFFGKQEKTDDESLPENTEDATPEKSDAQEVDVPKETSDDAVNDSDDEQNQEDQDAEDTDADDGKSTQEADLPAEEDIDWEYKIPVKVDGKVEYKTLEEVRKGFATNQHLSQKGRELGEVKKQVEEKANAQLNELVQIGTVLHEELTAVETQLATEYTKIVKQIEKAQEDGDTYTARELKEKRDDLQEKYWKTRTKREESAKKVVEKIQAKQREEQEKLLDQFNKDIVDIIPGFDEKLGKSIREFALKEGIPGEILNHVYDARIVRALNEYRLLKTAKESGVQKRKAALKVKSIPSKKGPTQAQVTKRSSEDLRSKVFSGSAGKDEQNAFLKSISRLGQKL